MHISQIPCRVIHLAAGDPLEWVWRNGLGGMTFRADHVDINGIPTSRFIKWQSLDDVTSSDLADVDLLTEAEKLRWASRYFNVPKVLDAGQNQHESWLVTQAIPSVSAVAPQWKSNTGIFNPESVVKAMAVGLRKLHDACPASECPFQDSWYDTARVPTPSQEDLVVCHGDPCVPNTLLNTQGEFVSLVDLARLGVADRWSDLAIATYSISWTINFGKHYDALFFDTYGIKPNRTKIDRYRALWDAPGDDAPPALSPLW